MVIMQYYGEIIPDIYPEDFAKIPENEKIHTFNAWFGRKLWYSRNGFG